LLHCGGIVGNRGISAEVQSVLCGAEVQLVLLDAEMQTVLSVSLAVPI
jgi:hypothetical protein